jgi:pimeloyl-ACP methyl ester carboxylesterase
MKNFLFIHGAWHGAWCWNGVLETLAKQHRVLATDLPGHGELIQPFQHLHLLDYVKHVIDLLEKSSAPVSLVGHSFAGFVISQVASLRPEKIKELIYINGLIPETGESFFSLTQSLKSKNLTPYLSVNSEHSSMSISSPPILKDYMYNCSNPNHIIWDSIQAEPLIPMTEPVQLDPYVLQDIPKKAIIGIHDKTLLKSDQIFMCKRYAIPYQLIDSDHCPFLSNPEKLVYELQQPIESVNVSKIN